VRLRYCHRSPEPIVRGGAIATGFCNDNCRAFALCCNPAQTFVCAIGTTWPIRCEKTTYRYLYGAGERIGEWAFAWPCYSEGATAENLKQTTERYLGCNSGSEMR